jgi:hypothetical protein
VRISVAKFNVCDEISPIGATYRAHSWPGIKTGVAGIHFKEDWVITFLCHRTCHHCYEDRFLPYDGAELPRVVEESMVNHPRIIENFPDRMT